MTTLWPSKDPWKDWCRETSLRFPQKQNSLCTEKPLETSQNIYILREKHSIITSAFPLGIKMPQLFNPTETSVHPIRNHVASLGPSPVELLSFLPQVSGGPATFRYHPVFQYSNPHQIPLPFPQIPQLIPLLQDSLDRDV